MKLTYATFACRASHIAASISGWAGNCLSQPADHAVLMSDLDLARFIREVQERLDRLWLAGVEWQPAVPEEGQPGSSFQAPRVSTIWPGLYTGRCLSCRAHILAEKRAMSCDDCERRRIEAVEWRRAELVPDPSHPDARRETNG